MKRSSVSGNVLVKRPNTPKGAPAMTSVLDQTVDFNPRVKRVRKRFAD